MRRTSTGEVKLDAIKCDYDNTRDINSTSRQLKLDWK